MSAKKLDLVNIFEREGIEAELFLKTPEDAAEKALRLRKDFLSFVVKDVAALVLAFGFVTIMGGYCCFVVGTRGVTSAEARAVLPLLTSLFGAVVGIAFGRATK